MGQDRLRPSLLDRIAESDKQNIPLLLDMVYGELMHKIGIVETQFKGGLSSHAGALSRDDGRLKKLENCPCAVHRDPAHTCVVLDASAAMADIKLEMAKEMGKIKVRLAWWAGVFTAVWLLLHLVAYYWPLFRG